MKKKYNRNSNHRWSSKYLPENDTICPHKKCVYNTNGWLEDFSKENSGSYENICDQPDINKENSDSTCHNWTNKRVMEMLDMFED